MKAKKLVLGLLQLSIFLALVQAPSAPGVPPHLSISAQGGNQVLLGWQDTNDWLQTTPTLLGVPYSWVNLGTTPANSMTLPANQPAQFFRLVVSPGGPPPTELYLASLSDTNNHYYFQLDWDPIPGAASYNLYMANAPGVSSQNYTMLFPGLTKTYAFIPDVPDGVFTPVLTIATNYYFVVTAVSSNGIESADSNPVFGMVGPESEVGGSVFTLLSIAGVTNAVDLPNVLLTLVNQSNPAFSNSVTSDVNGDFSFPDMPAGTYNLCWQANGFISGCSNGITLGNGGYDLGEIQLFPINGSGLLYGQVTFQDGSSVYDVDSFYNINVQPVVFLKTNQVTIARASVNSSGQYVMAGVPKSANLQVRVTVESASVVSNVNTLVIGEQDLVLPNTPPEIQSLIASTNGVQIYNVPAGTTVQVTVTATGHNLNYEWFDVNGLTAYPNSSNISWTLPANASGFQYLWVRVNDGSGGYAEQRLELDVNPYTAFEGVVLGSDTGLPLTNALVVLNGVTNHTDTSGFFSFDIYSTNQYNLNISANGYVSMSNVYLGPVSDWTYTLMAISAPQPVCPGGSGMVWATNCANGVIVGIPVGGLVYSNNLPYPAASCFNVSLSALDPCDSGFAGGAITTSNTPLNAFSLINIGATDLSGNPLYLATGVSAVVFTPFAATCNTNSFPTNAAVFAQNNGYWTQIATNNVAFTNTGCGANTVGFIFFPVSALGLLAGGPVVPAAAPAPVTFTINVDGSLHVPLRIGFFQDDGTGKAPKNKTVIPVALADGGIGDGYADITKPGQTIKLTVAGAVTWIEVLSLRQAPGDYYGNNEANPKADTDKDVIQALMVPAQAAGAPVTVTLGLGVGPAAPPDAVRSAPLKGLANQAAAAALQSAFLTRRVAPAAYNSAAEYYDLIDPLPSKKDTFDNWQKANGWGGAAPRIRGIGIGNDDQFAVYFNSTDLGAGRRTGMKISADGKSVAYYVATYNTLDDAVADQNDANANPAKGQAGASDHNLKYIVCMEYSPSGANPKPFVKFYAFKKDGTRTDTVENEAEKPMKVPFLCMNCHGAGTVALISPKPAAPIIAPGYSAGQFIAFDVANFTFDMAKFAPNMKPNAFNLAPNGGGFTGMNNGLLKGQADMPPTLKALITALAANNNFTVGPPAGWGAGVPAAPVALYNNVYAVSCRSCHATQCDPMIPANRGDEDWENTADFLTALRQRNLRVGVNANLSNAGRITMPHAHTTWGVFWGSATGEQLNKLNIIAQPVLSQPAQSGSAANPQYF